MRWLNYQHLYYFWHVAKAGSVTVAARQLRLAQPTVSAQLKAFEQVLGEKLFERQGRGIRLTETGHLAVRYAEQIFGLGQEFIDTLDGKTAPTSRELKIGIADVVPKILAFKLIEPALEHPEETVVICSENSTERLLADLAIGEIDLVVADRAIPPSVKVKAFSHFIGESAVSFLAVKTLAKKYRPGFPKSLAGAPVFLPTAESTVRAELDRWFESSGIAPRPSAFFQDRALMKLAAREGRGILPVPSSIAGEVGAEFGLELVGRIDAVPEQLYLISTERRLKNPLVARLCAEGQRRFAADGPSKKNR